MGVVAGKGVEAVGGAAAERGEVAVEGVEAACVEGVDANDGAITVEEVAGEEANEGRATEGALAPAGHQRATEDEEVRHKRMCKLPSNSGYLWKLPSLSG